MTTVSIEKAQAELPQLLEGLAAGDEVVIVDGAKPVGKLVRLATEGSQRIAGRGRGKVIVVAEDESHLDDFKDYMP
jgi:antitoxin (DNA-binding transcriptional repressor) of toxin-antitoxin stability system